MAMCPLLAHASFNTILWDNDLFSPRKTDAYYSNGFIYHHVTDPVPASEGREWKYCPGLGSVAKLAGALLIDVDEQTQYRHSAGLGQVIQTPLHLSLNPPDPDDQPYAGLLYGGCGFHVQTAERAESLGLMLGVVGPWSLAENTQDIAHRVTGSEYPAGWDYQLDNEVVVNLMYDRQKVRERFDLGEHGVTLFDSMGLALGPLMTSASLGINALYARNPDAIFSMRPSYFGRYPWLTQNQPLGFYAVGSLQVTGVLRNLFLDGNTWHDGPSVGHKPVVGTAQLVLGYGFSCLALQFGLTATTRTFDSQQLSWPKYGTLAVTWGCGP